MRAARGRGLRAAAAGVLCWTALLAAGESTPAPPPAPEAIQKLVKQLTSEVFRERQEAAEALQSFGAAILPYLAKLDATGDPDLKWRLSTLRQHAALAGAPGLADELRQLAARIPGLPAEERIRGLGALAQRGHAVAVPVLLGFLAAEKEPAVLEALARELGWLPLPPEAANPLLELYRREELPDTARAAALWALAQLPGDATRRLVREALAGGDLTLRLQALRAISIRLHDRESLPAIRKLAIGDGEIPEELRLAALEVLRDMLDPEASAVFKLALEGPREVKLLGLSGLAALQDRTAAPILAEMLKKEENNDLKDMVVDALGAIQAPESLPLFKACLKQEPPSLRISALLALVRMHAAGAAAEIAACLDDADPDVAQHAAQALGRLGYRDALPRIKAISPTQHPDSAIELAKALANLGDPEGLERLVRLAAGRTAQSQQALRLLSEWRAPQALPLFRGLAAEGHEDALFALVRLERDPHALRQIARKALADWKTDPGSAYAASAAAWALERCGMHPVAIRILEAAVAAAPEEDLVLGQLANAYHETGRYPECQAAFERLSRLNPEDASYYNNHGWFYATAFLPEYRRADEALVLASRAVALEPGEDYIVDTYGWALHAAGRSAEGAAQLRRALDMKEPADLPGRAWQKTRLARALWSAGKNDEARTLVAEALGECRDDEKTWFEAAGFYAGIGERDRAVHCLHVALDNGWLNPRAVELNPEFASLQGDYGYLAALDRARKAAQALERLALELEAEVKRQADGGGQDDGSGDGARF
ncbi:MAG: HEAT repeat domain-containing protein [Planctomycetota bacterium]|nr:HEAT repeat domain-containing protein [Planctomycetota bacterium]